LTLYGFQFLESARTEFRVLPAPLKVLFREKLIYLLRTPFRAYPWLRVRQGTRHPGEWRFRLGDFRVFYRIDGATVVFTRIARRPKAYPRRPPKSARNLRSR
jgi:mRNA-degrading endonuclease RelE of RelBE toxin-antitoxin system